MKPTFRAGKRKTSFKCVVKHVNGVSAGKYEKGLQLATRAGKREKDFNRVNNETGLKRAKTCKWFEGRHIGELVLRGRGAERQTS